jgi:WD40 repeat protein
VFGVALLTRSDGDRSVRTRPSQSTPPVPRRAVVARGATLQIVSTRDGRLLRTVTELPTPITSLVTSPDGSTVYASGAESNCEVGSPIFRIRLADGNVALIGSGFSLAMSPDGTHLAYNASLGCTTTGNGARIVSRDLATGSETVVDSLAVGAGIQTIEWSPDSRALLYEVGTGQGDQSVGRLQEWDVATGEHHAVEVETRGTVVGFRRDRQHLVVLDDVSPRRVSVLDVATGRSRPLFRSAYPVARVELDPSGDHALFRVLRSVVDGRIANNDENAIWRWTAGAGAPVLVTTANGPSAWLLTR